MENVFKIFSRKRSETTKQKLNIIARRNLELKYQSDSDTDTDLAAMLSVFGIDLPTCIFWDYRGSLPTQYSHIFLQIT